jgi:hypothetical protein
MFEDMKKWNQLSYSYICINNVISAHKLLAYRIDPSLSDHPLFNLFLPPPSLTLFPLVSWYQILLTWIQRSRHRIFPVAFFIRRPVSFRVFLFANNAIKPKLAEWKAMCVSSEATVCELMIGI